MRFAEPLTSSVNVSILTVIIQYTELIVKFPNNRIESVTCTHRVCRVNNVDTIRVSAGVNATGLSYLSQEFTSSFYL